jgi:ACT domain
VSYLLRLVLPDRPGILGAVATALGTAGADIVSLDVLERGDGYAVDDVVVDLPAGRLPDSLISAAQAIPDVEVESLRPFSGSLDTHRELELLESLACAERGTTVKLLAAELPRVLHSGWAAVLSGDGERHELRAASDAAPTFGDIRLSWLPLRTPALLPSDAGWLPPLWRDMAIEMMAAPIADDGRTVVLLGRSGGPAFRRSELLRLVHLAGLAATVAQLPPA